jgi:hypothetical protein
MRYARSQPAPLDFRIAVLMIVYLVFFAVALHYFLLGRHALAYFIVFAVFVVLLAWANRRNRR